MKIFIIFSLLVTGLLTFVSCDVPVARTSQHEYITILSDCLETKDTILFQSFTKQKNVRVYIRNASYEEINSKLRKEGLLTYVDVIILRSSYAMLQLQKQDFLQRIPTGKIPVVISSKYVSPNNDWLGIGIDPYIITTTKDSANRIKNYADLIKTDGFCQTLSDKELYPFYGQAYNKLSFVSDSAWKNWSSAIFSKSMNINMRDSISKCSVALLNYSRINKYKFDKKNPARIVFPNQHAGGCYYNTRSIGIVKQARNYLHATDFLSFLLLEPINQRLNNLWSTFPVVQTGISPYQYQNIRFKKYNYSPVQLNQEFNEVLKILSK